MYKKVVNYVCKFMFMYCTEYTVYIVICMCVCLYAAFLKKQIVLNICDISTLYDVGYCMYVNIGLCVLCHNIFILCDDGKRWCLVC